MVVPISVFCFIRTCIRFKNLVCDRRLWTSFDYSKLALSVDEILKRFKYINKDTTEFKIKGLVKSFPHKKWQNNTITENLLEKLQKLTPHLESLEVYEGFLDFQKVNLLPNGNPHALANLLRNYLICCSSQLTSSQTQ